jgi:hypothetical protein
MTDEACWHTNYSDNYDVVQVIRLNLFNFRERIPSSFDTYVIMDVNTRRPYVLHCQNKYKIKFKLRISDLDRNIDRKWSCVDKPRFSTSRLSEDVKKSVTTLEQDCEVYLDGSGLQCLRC